MVDYFKVGTADFICSITLPYQIAHVAELCRTLATMKLTKYLIKLLPSPPTLSVKIRIHSDYKSVLSFLPSQYKIVSNMTPLHQVKREIMLIE